MGVLRLFLTNAHLPYRLIGHTLEVEVKENFEIEVFGITPVSCNSVQSNASYVISNTLQNKPTTPCNQTQAKAP